VESPGRETTNAVAATVQASTTALDIAPQHGGATPPGEVIALDGPSGTGKSTVARALARRLRIAYLDTGAMYRAATVAVLDAGVDTADSQRVAEVVGAATIAVSTDIDDRRTRLGQRDISEEIRGDAVTSAVSAVSAVPAVRVQLVEQQRRLVGSEAAVVEGRDIGTVVFPSALLKVYLTADVAERARRRSLQTAGDLADLAAVQHDLDRRDTFDSTRTDSPLSLAPDAQVVDTTHSSIDEVVNQLVDLYRSRTAQGATESSRSS